MSAESRFDPEVAAEVLARAAALDAARTDSRSAPAGLDEATVLEVGRDVGLSEASVRQALDEHRAGTALETPPVPVHRLFGSAAVVVDRVVPASQGRALVAVEAGLRRAHLQRRRSLPLGSVWTPRTGPVASVRRTMSSPGPLRWLTRVDVQVARIDADSSRVQVVAWAEKRRRELQSWTGTGLGFAVVGTGLLAGLGIVLDPLWLLGTPATAATGPVSLRAGRGAWIGTRQELTLSLQGLLDDA